MSTALAVRFAQLRDGVRWDAALAGVSADDGGVLRLRRVPAPPADQPVRVPLPAVVPVSGIAADACGRVLLTDALTRTVILDWRACERRYVQDIDGGVIAHAAPGGVAVHDNQLFVADSDSGSVLVLALPSLELRRVINSGLVAPTRVSVDDSGRLYVIDSVAKSVRRFSADGAPDPVFDAAMAAHALADPFDAVWVAGSGLLVSEIGTGQVLVFDGAGQSQGTIVLPISTPAIAPRCLAAHDGLIVVSDSANGHIVVVDAPSRSFIGIVPDWIAPVAAMAFDSNGDLLVKTDAGGTYYRLAAGAGCVATGTLTAGPVDAGIEVNWERVDVDVEMPNGTDVVVETFVAAASTPAPSTWSRVPGFDAIFARADGPDSATPGARRFLWLRVTMASDDGRTSPTVADVRAHTTEASYLGQLPRVYARDDAKTRFLERLLALGRSEFDDWDAAVDGVFRLLDPARAPADDLPWLRSALALNAPAGATAEFQRTLLARAPELYARRGTAAGLRDAVEIAAGVRPTVLEAFWARRTWTLGEASLLGVDSALAPAAIDGLIVPGHVRTDPSYHGLAGEYYAGFEFDRAVMRRTDNTISFDASRSVVPEEAGTALNRFSVRWSGQIKPRFSEIYTFYFAPIAGVRLWVDGALLIDTWTQNMSSATGARVPLDASRWSALTCEMHRVVDPLDPVDVALASEASLEWSSRSEPRAIVPEECLYSVADDRADLEPPVTDTVEVGNAVVGASGPARPSDFGAALFADYAHLFTVMVPAALVAPSQRQAVREAIDAEKPAHTDYHLCFADARLRVGFQARLGIDAIVAGGPAPLRLGDTSLGRDSVLADAPAGGARIGSRARLGHDTVIG